MNASAERNRGPEVERELRALMARYCDAVNRQDGDDWISCWADDAQWVLMGTGVSGQRDILALWQQLMSGFDFVLMLPSSCLFAVEGTTVTGHWYLQEYTRDKHGNSTTNISRYRDTYREVDGQWRYQTRECHFIVSGAAGLDGPYNPLVKLPGNPLQITD
ncbi:nuclear transport factor 2 family protein [Microbulbifer sp. SAOS-129_SWC]|uniref:nuclear transport factor 2 family protein n=1 Tax=Microbulbifer sp. SAOS-129_SWC TaxID=3145235 RepID=UPI003216B22B